MDQESDISNTVTYVQSLLDLKARFDHFLKNSFSNDHIFKQAISSVSPARGLGKAGHVGLKGRARGPCGVCSGFDHFFKDV